MHKHHTCTSCTWSAGQQQRPLSCAKRQLCEACCSTCLCCLQSMDRCVEQAKQALAADSEHCNATTAPPQEWFTNNKLTNSLRTSVKALQEHLPAEERGWAAFMKLCGRQPHDQRNPNGWANLESVEHRLQEYVRVTNTTEFMPKQSDIQKASKDRKHMHHHLCKGLVKGIIRAGESCSSISTMTVIMPLCACISHVSGV